jgi:uncharacterized spore protein YtfJ
MSVEEPIKSTLEGLLKVLNIENVIGDPIESEDKILIPVTRMGIAFGAAMGQGESSLAGNKGAGSGAGGGAAVEPLAFIVVDKNLEGPENIKVLSLTPPDPLNRAIGEVGEIALGLIKEWQKREKEKDEEIKKANEEPKDLYTP